MKTNFLYLALILLLTFCSDHEEISDRPYPMVSTKPVTSITPDGSQFHGEVLARNGNEIIDHGFVWAIHSNPNETTNEKKSLGIPEGNRFSATISTTLKAGVTYYVRSYVKTEKHAVYGNAVSFVSLGSKAPTITDFYPKIGRARDTVSIAGSGFSFIKSNNLIAFATIKANLVSHSDTLLKVIVPDLLQVSKSKILVSLAGNLATSQDEFTLLKGEISSISKSVLRACDTLTISGSDFTTNPTLIQVKLNNVVCRVLNLTSSEIKIVVPILLTNTETVTLKIVSLNIQEVYDGPLTYKKPQFIGLDSRSNTTFNDTLTIRAKNLPRCETMTVKIGSITPALLTQNDSTISFKIPESLNQTQNTVSVSFSNTTLIYNKVVSLSAPVITAVTPLRGVFNEDVVIRGKNFHPQAVRNIITLVGSTSHVVISADPTELKTKVSTTSTCGTCGQARVTVDQQTAIFQDGITLRLPTITSISPSSFNAPGEITINGNNFNPQYELNQVSVGSATSSTRTKITANINLNTIANGDLYLTSSTNKSVVVTAAGQSSGSQNVAFEYTGPWTRKANFPGTTRLEPITLVLNNKLYMGLGQAQNGQYLNDIWEYDPSTNIWSQKGNFPGSGRRGAVSFVADEKGYAGLGVGSTPNLKDLWSYNPTLDAWTPLNDFPGGSKNNAASFVISDVAYITGGSGTTVWKYNSTLDTWDQLNNTPVVFQLSNFVLNGKAYLIRPLANSFDLYEYNEVSDQWTLKVTNTSYSNPVAVSGGYVYSNNGVFQKYNATTNTFENLEMRATANRITGTSCGILNKQYIFGGRPSSGVYHFDVWEFDYSIYPD